MGQYIKHRLFAPLLILVAGLLVTGLVINTLRLEHQQNNLESFRYDVDRRANAIQTLVNKDIELIGSAANFFFASEQAHWNNFEYFAPYVLSGSETLIALEWLEKIPQGSIQERVVEVSEKFPHFQVYSVIDKEVVPGLPTAEGDHFIMTDIMPRSEINLGLLGFYSSQERFQYILNQIATSGEPVVSDKVRLLQDGTESNIEKNGILIYHPVYSQNQTELKGVVIGVIRASAYIDTLFDIFSLEQPIDTQIQDTGFEAEDDSLLYADVESEFHSSQMVRNIYLPNRVWQAHFSFQGVLGFEQKTSILMSGLAGLILTLTLSGLFYYLNNERLIIGRMLADRTRDLEEIAYKDPLTGLANRREFDRHFNSRVEEREPFGLLVIDIDDFKKINDEHGHSVGDRTLVKISQLIETVSGPDALVARIGGDELAVICDTGSYEVLADKAESLCNAIEECHIVELGARILPKVSVGGAVWRKSVHADEMHRAADRALYDAKSRGKNRFVISQPTGSAGPRMRLI